MRSAVVLSGGGAKGMIEVGALDYLLEAGLEITEIAGISTGALQACLYASPRLRASARATWDGIRARDVYRRIPLPLALLGIAFGRHGLYSNRPLRRLLARLVDPREFTCPVRVGYVDLDTGRLTMVGSTELPPEKFLDAVWASATMPLIWPPVHGRRVDGGLRQSLPLSDMIARGAERIVGVLCSPRHLAPFDASSHARTLLPHVTEFAEDADRVMSIVLAQVATSSLEQVLFVNRLVAEAEAAGITLSAADGRLLRHVPTLIIAPPDGTDVGGVLDFSAAWKTRRYDIGRDAAERALAEASGFGE